MADVYVVTGGARGIGAATVRRLAADGHAVCFTWVSQQQQAETLAAECRGHGVESVTVRADVASKEDVLGLFEQVDRIGPLRGLVNNAGVLGPQGRVEDLDPSRIMRTLEVNVLGTLLCCREAVARMSTRRGGAGGAIVNVSSRAAVLGAPNEYVDYAASKAAVDAITVGLAAEVAGEGIRVSPDPPSDDR